MLMIPIILLTIVFQLIWSWHCISEYKKNRKKFEGDPRKYHFLEDAEADWKETKQAIFLPGLIVICFVIAIYSLF